MRFHAGPLTAYYSRGLPAAERARIRTNVGGWWSDVEAALEGHLSSPLSCEEDTPDTLSLEITDTEWCALQLLAAYAESTNLHWPDHVPPSREEDPAWQKVSVGDFSRTKFPHVLIPTFWAPGDFDFTAKQPMPDGDERVFGSLDGLCRQLGVLNAQTLQLVPGATPAPPSGDGFLECAELGLARAIHAAAWAAQRRVALLIE